MRNSSILNIEADNLLQLTSNDVAYAHDDVAGSNDVAIANEDGGSLFSRHLAAWHHCERR